MVNILLSGCSGKMGSNVIKCSSNYDDVKIIEGVDKFDSGKLPFKVYSSFEQVAVRPDVIIDFSNPDLLNSLLMYAITNNVPVVLCSTGYDDSQIEAINNASQRIPVFFSGNMSLGINVLIDLAKKASQILGDKFDIEIIEKHHNQKLDAPSGTALMISNGIQEVLDDKELVYDRHLVKQKREPKEIGMHSIRGGTIVGEHEVIFAGHDEVISIKHQAQSKEVFAEGSIKAARFLVGKEPKLYQMSDMLQ